MLRVREPDVDEVAEEHRVVLGHVAGARDDVELGREGRAAPDLGPLERIGSNTTARDSPVVAGSPRALIAVDSGSPMKVHESCTIPRYSGK
jgi:hypothetical protein